MAEFLTQAWCDEVLVTQQQLPDIDHEDFGVAFSVPITRSCKTDGFALITQGRITALGVVEKGQDPNERAKEILGSVAVATTLEVKVDRALKIATGKRNFLAAYMVGELKIEDRYELIVDLLANGTDHDAWRAITAEIAAFTD